MQDTWASPKQDRPEVLLERNEGVCHTIRRNVSGCKAFKFASLKAAAVLQPLAIPFRRWSVIMDLITSLPTSREGHDSVLPVVGSLSKMAPFIPTSSYLSAMELVALFAYRVVRYHSLPSTSSRTETPDLSPRFKGISANVSRLNGPSQLHGTPKPMGRRSASTEQLTKWCEHTYGAGRKNGLNSSQHWI